MSNHELEIRQKASDMAANKCLTEFEKQSLQIQKQQLELQEKRDNNAEKAEKDKAGAAAEAKYDEILATSAELEDNLDQVADWSKATRAEITSAMQSLDKWNGTYQSMNKAYREYNIATSKYQRLDLYDRVEEVIQETTTKYKKVVEQVRQQDRQRELYSLAGSNSEQVKLPKFSGSQGEDFFTFKRKLCSAFKKNRVPL